MGVDGEAAYDQVFNLRRTKRSNDGLDAQDFHRREAWSPQVKCPAGRVLNHEGSQHQKNEAADMT